MADRHTKDVAKAFAAVLLLLIGSCSSGVALVRIKYCGGATLELESSEWLNRDETTWGTAPGGMESDTSRPELEVNDRGEYEIS